MSAVAVSVLQKPGIGTCRCLMALDSSIPFLGPIMCLENHLTLAVENLGYEVVSFKGIQGIEIVIQPTSSRSKGCRHCNVTGSQHIYLLDGRVVTTSCIAGDERYGIICFYTGDGKQMIGRGLGTIGSPICKVPGPGVYLTCTVVLKCCVVFGTDNIWRFEGGIDRIVEHYGDGRRVCANSIGDCQFCAVCTGGGIDVQGRVLQAAGIGIVKNPHPLVDPVL